MEEFMGEVRAELVAMACQDEYARADLLQLCSSNPGIDPRIDALLNKPQSDAQQPQLLEDIETITLRGDKTLNEVRAAGSDCEDRPLIKAAFATELLLCLAARTVSQHVAPFLVVCLSMLALKCGVATEMWAVMQMLLVLRTKPWITKFAREVAQRLHDNLLMSDDVCTAVRFVVGDNCSYKSHIVHEHVDRQGELIHTVNWLWVPLSIAKLGNALNSVKRGRWLRAGYDRFSVRQLPG